MQRVKRILTSDAVYEGLVVAWILASPLAIKDWVQGLEDPITWAAFIAGVIGVIVGWLVVAPHDFAQRRPEVPQKPS
jgi:membrane protein YdbS with pleckstrin-like domain